MKKLFIVTALFTVAAGSITASQLPMVGYQPKQLGQLMGNVQMAAQAKLARAQQMLKNPMLKKRDRAQLLKDIEQYKKEIGKGGLQKRPVMQTRS